MNLTLTQAFHRTQDLGGLIKAGESALADCADDAAAKQRIADIAVEGVNKAKATLAALYAERDELADHMAALVRQTGDAVAVEPTEPLEDGWVREWSPELGAYVSRQIWKSACGHGAPCDQHSCAVPPGFADFGHPTQNGLDDSAVNAAFDRSTHP